MICDGSSLATAGTYAGLFGIIGYTYGGAGANFNLPNLVQNFPLGASSILPPGYDVGGEAAVTLDTTMIPSHSHSVAVTETPHTHTASTPAHTHSMTDHTHTVNQVFGGGSEIQSGSGWGQHNVAGGAMTSIPNVGTTATGITVSANSTGVSIPGNATGSTGGGAIHNNIPPYTAINFIVRYQ